MSDSEFGFGIVTSLLVAATWYPWILTWGDDTALNSGAAVMAILGFVWGCRARPIGLGRMELGFAACLVALIQPWWHLACAASVRHLPEVLVTTEAGRFGLGLGTGLVPGFLSTALWACLCRHRSYGPRFTQTNPLLRFSLGLMVGVIGGPLLVANLIGPWGLAVVSLLGLLAVSGWRMSDPPVPNVVSGTTGPAAEPDSVVDWCGLTSACVTGCVLAALLRLLCQVFPVGSWVPIAAGLGVVAGVALELVLRRSLSSAPSVALVAAMGTLVLAGFPGIVFGSFWTTAVVTSVPLLSGVRILLLATTMIPGGFALSRLAAANRDSSWVWGLAAVGFLLAQTLMSTSGASLALALGVLILVVLAGTSAIRRERNQLSTWSWRVLATCSATGLTVPFWQGQDDPARVAKLCFSTSSFVAYQSGWDPRLLTSVDDARMVDQSEGLRGPLTLWRSHGLEIHLRDNGVPRATASSNTALHPQAAPEVLQAVLPMTMAHDPRTILVLGASSGVPLWACAQFPAERLICVDNDGPLVRVVRGPLARQIGRDPFADSRVELVTAPVPLAVMRRDSVYDVILSSPPQSSLMSAGAQFTVEHYQQVAVCLAPGGIFCQRFDCVDYGPWPLRTTVQSMQQAFQDVMVIEVGAGELLLFGTNTPGQFTHADLASRMEAGHVRRLLARTGFDWTSVLNLPAYDQSALTEICRETWTRSNHVSSAVLALNAPSELMRWGSKLAEVQAVLTAPRAAVKEESPITRLASRPSRKSRILEWLGEERITPEILRRLSDVAAQRQLVREFPESHWWEYRKVLRKQLQTRARSLVQQVSHSDDVPLHPEDERRKRYFVALGEAARQPSPTADAIGKIEEQLWPYDPLLTYFAHEEVADLQARGGIQADQELANRLHMVYFAPPGDGSTKPITSAMDLLVQTPDLIPDPTLRFDLLNGLIQTLRSRWEQRQSLNVVAPRRQVSDADRNIVAIEHAVQALDAWQPVTGLSRVEWEHRKQVIDRILLRPLRSHRAQLQESVTRTEVRARAALEGSPRERTTPGAIGSSNAQSPSP